ncbi:hypothetical protein LXL04_005585 [Taraxacum kok-saghyz]
MCADDMRALLPRGFEVIGSQIAGTTYPNVKSKIDFVLTKLEIKRRVATVVAHELAHQWFGNLVTMEWWTHLWLNEGFATWVSYLAADGLFPEWKIWTQFLDESTEGLRLDGLSESHPIKVEINHAGEIDEVFDAISYRKGASVIRMLQSYLGPQRALAKYVKRHACSNAKTEDLWAVLEEKSGQPVNKLMNSWTKQKGYSVISIKLKDNKLEFEQVSISFPFIFNTISYKIQVQFLSSGCQGEGQWVVPITLCTSSSWIKVNVDRAGFYRVKYDEQLSAKLRFAIENKQLSAMDRYVILDDSFALSMVGQLPLSSLLTLMGAYREEPDYTVLSNLITVSSKLRELWLMLMTHCWTISKYFSSTFSSTLQRESHLDALLRGELFSTLAVFGHEETLVEANKRFQAFLEDRKTHLLPPDIRRAVYVAVMKKVTAVDRSTTTVVLGDDLLLEHHYRYTSFIQPVTTSKLYNDVKLHKDLLHFETAYVVKLHRLAKLSPSQSGLLRKLNKQEERMCKVRDLSSSMLREGRENMGGLVKCRELMVEGTAVGGGSGKFIGIKEM